MYLLKVIHLTNVSKEEFDVIISSEPILVKTINQKQVDLLNENQEIIQNIATNKYMTAKEIHALFWESEQKKYTKTLKTIYRHLESLEQADLVKVAGRRKPKDSRTWERIYCRTAVIFYQKDKIRETSYWETDSGKKQLDIITNLFCEYHQLSIENKESFKKLFISFDDLQDKIIWEILAGTEDNENLASILSEAELNEIKFVVRSSAMFSAMLKKPEIIEELKKHFKNS